jgi:cyclophilin family peptidyl-prolyl cis-trans isomerase/protein-disulfide isomerase
MRKLFTLLLLASLLYACTPSPASPPSLPIHTAPVVPSLSSPTQPACNQVEIAPTPGSETPSLFAPENEADRARGGQDPILTITEYSDYQDPRSGELALVLERLLEENPEEVRVISRLFPLVKAHDKAAMAAQAAEAAAEQDHFWEMHRQLYGQQQHWIDLSPEEFEHWLVAQASALGMDVQQFRTDLQREDIVEKVQQAWEDGQKLGIPGTPLILLNGQIYGGPRNYASLNDIFQLIALGKRQYTTCPPMTLQQDRQYIATLHTAKGDIMVELFADKAPLTVNSFLFLVEEGWYKHSTFHRVIPDLFAQTGDPSGTGKGHPGYYIVTEVDPSLTFDQPGRVAMVNSGPDTNGSQFFITYAPAPSYNGKYTIFGQVIDGMDILEALTPRDPQPGSDTPPGDELIDISIEEK